MQLAQRLDTLETSAIRALFKLLGQPGIISFAGGFPDATLFDVEGMQIASQQALQNHAAAALQYGATEGYAPLQARVAALLQQNPRGAMQVQPDQLSITTGSQQALDLIGKTMIDPGDKVIVESPTFLATIQCFRLYGADLISAPVDDQGVQTDALEALITTHRPKLIYLIPTFGNPSGALLSLQRRRRVLELAARYHVSVVEDDPYGALYFDVLPPPTLLSLSQEMPQSQAWLAHCGSFSKILAPGLRLGWLVAPPELLAKVNMCKQFSDACSSTLAQVTAHAYLGLSRLEQQIQRVRKTYGERAQTMCNALQRDLGDSLAFTTPAGGMFVWVRMHDTDANAFAQRALAHKVAFVPGAPFYANNPDPNTLRLSFATSDKATIEEGVARLASAL